MRSAFRLVILTSLLAVAVLAAPGSADARERGARGRGGAHPARSPSGSAHTEVTRTGPGGQSRTWRRDDSWQRTDTGRSRSTTWTNPQGGVATRDATVLRDREAGTRSRDVTFTGRNGEVRTRHDESTKTEDGRTGSSTLTRPDGSTVTWERSREVEPGEPR